MQPRRGNKDANAIKISTRRSRNTLIFAIPCLIIFVVCVFWVFSSSISQPNQEDANTNETKAAILDGLYDKTPNSAFIEKMVQYLSNAGYMVDVYRGSNVTIDLLRSISGYKLLILRLHSAVHSDSFLYLFSGEKYTESKYVDEQLAGAVRKAYTFDETEPPYFALNSVFLGKLKPNSLNGTTLIMMGCNGTANDYVIQRFFEEGVQVYLSWDGYVDLAHSDEATLRLVKAICAEGLNPEEAVEKVNKELGPDPSYASQLICKLP